MTAAPYVYTDAPEVKPYRYGLFGAAQPMTGIDPHWRYGGIEFDSLPAYEASLYPSGIQVVNGSGGTKTLPGWLGTVKALPFAVYGGVLCGTIGYTDQAARDRALKVVELAGQHASESALWNGGGANAPALNAASTPIVQATAVSLQRGVAALEDWLADHYNGQGLIHGKRSVGIIAGSKQLVHHDPDTAESALMTPVGTRWVFGGGYDGTGPAAVAPAAGQTWIYATGQVGIVRDEAQTPAGLGEALDRLHNQVQLIAEQQYLIAVDYTIGAALVDLTL